MPPTGPVSAFNNIVITRRCPACEKDATIRCITRVASAYAGTDTYSFCLRDYRLGERMPWFPEGHAQHKSWNTAGGASIVESCLAICMACFKTLRAKVKFESLTPVDVSDVTLLK